MLESRETPANDLWTNATGDGLFGTAGNWQDGSVPGANDTVILGGPGGSNTDITFPAVANKVYVGIQIKNTYAGTANFPADVSFGSYFQAGGTTNQIGYKTVTVTSDFIWTGGDVNPTGQGTYLLKGVQNGRIGEDATDLTCGSRIVLEKRNAILTNLTQSGSLTLVEGHGEIEVRTQCWLFQARVNPAGAAPEIAVSAPGEGGDLGVTLDGGGFASYGGTVPAVSINGEGGKLYVCAGGLTVTGACQGIGFGVQMTANGEIHIYNGETLTAALGVYMDVGTFATDYSATAAQQTATIDGTFRMTGGVVHLGTSPPQGTTVYAKLVLTETAELWGGAFATKIDPQNANNCDVIHSQDKLHTKGEFMVSPQTIAALAAADVLTSANGFTADSVDPQNADDTSYIMGKSGDGKKWTVKRNP